MLRILVVDDSEAVRHGLISLLASEPSWILAGEANDGIDAASRAQQMKPDVILLDISLPRVNGLVAAQVIRRLVPDAEILFVSQHSSRGFVEEAFKVGARGYLCKADAASQLLDAVRAVSQHERFLSSSCSRLFSEHKETPSSTLSRAINNPDKDRDLDI